ncbi:hypothetical protein N2152v2_008157 [Parachlorella kessleri]
MFRLRAAASKLWGAQGGAGRAWAAAEEVSVARQALGGAARFGSKSGASDSLFVTNASGLKGNSPILIGLMEYFQRHLPSVGFFQPIGSEPLAHAKLPVPKHVAVLREHFGLKDDPQEMYGVTEEEASNLLAAGKTAELFEKVETRYREYKRGKDLVIVEGATVDGIGNLLELNGRFAAELDAPVLMIMDFKRDEKASVSELYNRAMIHKQDLQSEHAGENLVPWWESCTLVGISYPGVSELYNRAMIHKQDLQSEHAGENLVPWWESCTLVGISYPGVSELYNRAMIHKQDLQSEHADVLGVVLNKVPKQEHAVITSQLAKKLTAAGLPFAGGIVADYTIGTARMNEICTALDARLLYGSPEDLDCDVADIMVCAEDVASFLDKIDQRNADRAREGLHPVRPLVITSKTRADVILSLTAAHVCGTGPHIAGLLLTDSTAAFGTAASRILTKYSDQLVPIAEVPIGAFETARRVATVNPGILPNSAGKIDHAKELFSEYIDANLIASQLALPKTGKLTPKRFINNIHEICRSHLQNIVLPEAHDKRVLAAAAEVVGKGLARVTLLGKPEEVKGAAEKFGIDISGCEVMDYMSGPTFDRYAEYLVEARKSKGLTLEQARDQMADMNMFGTMMVRAGDADGMVSGATCTTANTIRPALQILKTQPPTLVSSIFFMCLPDKVLTYGDCAVVVDPKAEELAEVAICSGAAVVVDPKAEELAEVAICLADTAAAFGIEPRVAMLSYSTLGSGSGPQVEKVTKATAIVKERRSDLKVEGPLQYDASVDPTIAAQKIKGGSEVAGKATVCIFPDLNTGNNTYKAVQQSTGAIAIGPLMQGLTRPVNDLSRGCTVADIVNTVACTAVQAIGKKRSMAVDPVATAA